MIRGTVQYRGLGVMFGRGHGYAAKTLRDVVRNGMLTLGRFWHSRVLPQHFLPSAVGRYSGVYENRTQRYLIRKGRGKGHQNPLEYSGTLKRLVTSSAEIRATSRGVRVKMMGPPWLRKPGQATEGQPDLGAEITATNESEMTDFARSLDRFVYGELTNKRSIFRLPAGGASAAAG